LDFDLSTAEGMRDFAKYFKANIKAGGTVPKTIGTGAHDLTEKIGGSSSGGGGSTKQETHKQEEERYHYETELLSDLEKQLERLKKAKDRVYGPNRVKAIDQEIKALEEEIEAQKRLIEEVKRYEKQDLDALLHGKKNGMEI